MESPDKGSNDPAREAAPYGTLVTVDGPPMSDHEMIVAMYEDMRAIRQLIEQAAGQVTPIIDQIKSNPMLSMFFS